jgi:hypothetical protein
MFFNLAQSLSIRQIAFPVVTMYLDKGDDS